MSKLRTLLTGLAALAGIVLVVAGVPFALYEMLGSPIPTGLPTNIDQLQIIVQSSGDGTLLLGLLKYVAWLAWLSFTASIAVQFVAQLRHIQTPHIHGLVAVGAAGKMVAAVLAIGAIVSVTTLAPAVHAVAAGDTSSPTRSGPVATAPQAAGATHQTATAADTTAPPTTHEVTEQVARVRTVVSGDNLTKIARDEYDGDGNQWHQIFEENKGAKQDGGTLRNPNLIKPGLKLTIPGKSDTITHTVAGPAQASPPAPASTPGDAANPAASPAAASSAPAPAPAVAPSAAATSAPSSAPSEAATTAPAAPAAPTVPATSWGSSTSSPTGEVGTGVGTGPAAGTSAGAARSSSSAVEVGPSAAAALSQAAESPVVRTVTGLGGLAAAGVLMLLSRRRRRQARDRRPGQRISLPSGDAAVAESQLRAAADPITVAELDRTLRTLSHHCGQAGLPVPELRAARITPDTVELYLVDETVILPEPFEQMPESAGTWTLDRTHFDAVLLPTRDALAVPAPYPTLVTLGQDQDDAHLLVNLEQLRSLAITGPHAADALKAITLELIACQWADDAVITVVGVMRDVVEAVASVRVTYLDDLDQILNALEFSAGADREAMTEAGVTNPETARAAGVHSDYVTPRLIILGEEPTSQQRDRLQTLLLDEPRVAVAALTSDADPLGQWRLDVSAPDRATLEPAGVELTPQHLSVQDLEHILDVFRAADQPHRDGPRWTTQLITEDQLADLDTLAEVAATNHADVDDVDDQVDQVDQVKPAIAAAPTSAVSPFLVDPVDHVDHVADRAGPGEIQDADAQVPHTTPAAGDVTGAVEVGEGQVVVPDDAADIEGPGGAGAAALRGGGSGQEELLPAGRPVLRLLGPIRVDNAQGNPPEASWKALKLLTFMALRPGRHSPEYDQAVWRKPMTTKYRSNLTTQTRYWVGFAPDGHPYLPDWTKTSGYRLADDMLVDWHVFRRAIGRNFARTPTADLTAALNLVYGSPLSGEDQYQSDQSEMTHLIADVAHEVACRQLTAGQPAAAACAASKGLEADPCNEKLWRLQIKATSLLGDRDRLAGVIRQLDQVMETDSDLEQETEELIAKVLQRSSA